MMRKTLYSVQCLRALAAIMVVVYHSQCLLVTYQSRIGIPPSIMNATPNIAVIGASGVDLFFVISGFIMAYITYNNRGKHAILPFLKNRIVRIVPLYWFFTLLMSGLLLFVPNLFSSARFDGYGTLLSLLFIPYRASVSPNSPVFAVGWTLSYEMYFYILIAAGLLLERRLFSIGLGIFFAGSIAVGHLIPSNNPVLNLVTNPKLLEFYFGYLLGWIFISKNILYQKYVAFICIASGLAGYLYWILEVTTLPIGLFAFLIVAGFVLLEDYFTSAGKYIRFFSRIGDSSYSLYLSHYLLIPALGKACILTGFWNHFPPAAFIAISLPTCVAAGYMVYLFVERPLITCKLWKKHF